MDEKTVNLVMSFLQLKKKVFQINTFLELTIFLHNSLFVAINLFHKKMLRSLEYKFILMFEFYKLMFD